MCTKSTPHTRSLNLEVLVSILTTTKDHLIEKSALRQATHDSRKIDRLQFYC